MDQTRISTLFLFKFAKKGRILLALVGKQGFPPVGRLTRNVAASSLLSKEQSVCKQCVFAAFCKGGGSSDGLLGFPGFWGSVDSNGEATCKQHVDYSQSHSSLSVHSLCLPNRILLQKFDRLPVRTLVAADFLVRP